MVFHFQPSLCPLDGSGGVQPSLIEPKTVVRKPKTVTTTMAILVILLVLLNVTLGIQIPKRLHL